MNFSLLSMVISQVFSTLIYACHFHWCSYDDAHQKDRKSWPLMQLRSWIPRTNEKRLNEVTTLSFLTGREVSVSKTSTYTCRKYNLNTRQICEATNSFFRCQVQTLRSSEASAESRRYGKRGCQVSLNVPLFKVTKRISYEKELKQGHYCSTEINLYLQAW